MISLMSIGSERNNKKLSENEYDFFTKELRDSANGMDDYQLRQFLLVSAIRNIIYLNGRILRIADTENIYYFNHLLFSISLNCILYFPFNRPDINLDIVRALIIDLEHNRLPTIIEPNFYIPRSSMDISNLHNNAYGNISELIRDKIRNRKARIIQKNVRFIDSAISLSQNISYHSISIAIELVGKRRTSAEIMLRDAKTIMNGAFNFYNSVHNNKCYEDDFHIFLSILKKLDGEYWAVWFDKLFKNNFLMDENSVEAILSLVNKSYNLSIAQSSFYLSSFISENTDSNEIRLMILGGKGEGKTSFAKRFKKLSAPMPKGFESTEGIDFDEFMSREIYEDIKSIEIDKNYRNILIKIWDFAGHEVTHAAHKFFLSDRCIYVVVCQARQVDFSINSKIEYWLEHIRDYAKGIGLKRSSSKIFILINEWDDNRPQVNETSIRVNYPEYDLVFRYINIAIDNQEDGKLNRLRHEILNYINIVDTKIPTCYKLMQEQINSKFKENYFISTKSIYQVIENVKAQGINMPHDKTEVLSCLHSLGFCFWFSDIKGINTIVLNPRWITGAVYKIINWVQNSDVCNNASICKNDFSEALRKTKKDESYFPKDKDNFIFKSLEQFELAYCEDENTLIIPHCLKDSYPDEDIGLEFDFKNSVQIEFSIYGLPNMTRPVFNASIIPRFIVKKYSDIYKNNNKHALISINGAIFESSDHDSLAEIKKYPNDDYRLCIIVKGKNFNKNIIYLYELSNCLKQILFEQRRFQEHNPIILYYATDINGNQISLPIDDLRTKGLSKIAAYKGRKFKKEEYSRIDIFINNFYGGINMRDLYNAQQVGIQGSHAGTDAVVNQIFSSFENNIDYMKIMNEVETIKKYLHNTEPSDDRDILIGELAQFNKALEKKDDNKIVEIIKSCGKQLYDIAERIGCSLIATFISKQMWP